MKCILFSLAAAFCFSVSAIAQLAPKDPDAVAALNQMVAATGWTSLTMRSDVAVAGTVTRYNGGIAQDTIPIAIKFRGSSKFRVDLQEPGRNATVIANGPAGAIAKAGEVQGLPAHAAVSLAPPIFPYLTNLAAGSDPQVSLKYLGAAIIRNEPSVGIRVSREPQSGGSLAAINRLAGPITVWISTRTWLPVEIEYVRLAITNHNLAIPYKRFFSDFRVVAGIMTPFRQEEFAGSEIQSVLQMSVVQLNTGITDQDFTVPPPTGRH